jgi:hypothetical protein
MQNLVPSTLARADRIEDDSFVEPQRHHLQQRMMRVRE